MPFLDFVSLKAVVPHKYTYILIIDHKSQTTFIKYIYYISHILRNGSEISTNSCYCYYFQIYYYTIRHTQSSITKVIQEFGKMLNTYLGTQKENSTINGINYIIVIILQSMMNSAGGPVQRNTSSVEIFSPVCLCFCAQYDLLYVQLAISPTPTQSTRILKLPVKIV